MIENLIEELLKKEGGYSNEKSDRGGETKYGITRFEAIKNGFNGDMRELPIDFAVDIYKKKYWIAPGFDKIANYSERLATELFDFGVNMGVWAASKTLQRSLNLFNRGGKLFSDIKIDGVVGHETLNALKSFLEYRKNETVLVKAVISLRAVRYIEISEQDNSQEDFIYGWLDKRVNLK